MGIIYCYTNKINGKKYVGQTIHPEKRKWEHSKAYDDSIFHRAIRKYGFDAFDYEVIEECENEFSDELEIKYKKELNNLSPKRIQLKKWRKWRKTSSRNKREVI